MTKSVHSFLQHLSEDIVSLKDQGLYKTERIITSPQQAIIQTQGSALGLKGLKNPEIKNTPKRLLNLCANNYLCLANHPDMITIAQQALNQYGYGMSSVRFICGTQTIHKQLEQKISEFLKTEDTILYSSCFDANTGLFETLLGEEDAVISDALNHASIIDGIRLCKAKRFRYKNNDMQDLEFQLKAAGSARFKLIATDGVFSMDGTFARLKNICDLADQYQAMVMVDDSHAVGVLGEHGRGTPEHWGVMERVDILTGTLGKALGGASGGYTSGRKEIIEWLRQRSRPYLFSNTLAPVMAATSIHALELLEKNPDLKKTLQFNTQYFREGLSRLGFEIVPGEHPIIPIMLYDAKKSLQMAESLYEHGVYVISFSFPVVPENKARIRTQMSSCFTKEHLDTALEAFALVGKKLGIIS